MFSRNSQCSLPLYILVSFASMFLITTSCIPKIEKFTPERGKVGTEVTIEGKRFGGTAADNAVMFKDVTATEVTVPDRNKIIAKVDKPGRRLNLGHP